MIYEGIHGEDAPLISALDFRKQLYLSIRILRTTFTSQDTFGTMLYHCAGLKKYIHGTVLRWIQPGGLRDFAIADFKKVGLSL